MQRYGFYDSLRKNAYLSSRFFFFSAIIAALIVQILLPAMSAFATPTFNTYPISSTYTKPEKMTVANGSLWYTQLDSAGNKSIASMTTSGAVANYSVLPSGASYMKIHDITTGPDGNVWFTGCSSANSTDWTVETGRLDVVTGIATFYSNVTLGFVPCNEYPGSIATGPDGAVWYAVNRVVRPTSKTTYLFAIDPSAGTTSTRLSINAGSLGVRGMTTGPDGRLWITNGAVGIDRNVNAYTISSAGTITSTSVYPTGNGPRAIISGPDGNLWFVEAGHNKIGKLTTSGVLSETSSGLGVGVSIQSASLAADSDGGVWFTGNEGVWGVVGRISTDGGITKYRTPTGSYVLPYVIVSGPDDAMWFTYYSNQTSPGVYSLGRVPATPTFDSYPISSTYTKPEKMTVANGSLWYTQLDSAGNKSIASMTTGGVVADYSVLPPGASYMKIHDITTGPDGNVWFTGCSSLDSIDWTVEAGRLDSVSGAVTYFSNSIPGPIPCNEYPGSISTGPDGAVWYAVNRVVKPTSKTTYIFSIDVSTGLTSTRLSINAGSLGVRGMTTGQDGRLWVTNGAVGVDHNVNAYTISSAGTIISTSVYPTGNGPRAIINGLGGNLWFVEAGHNKIGKLTTAGALTETSYGLGLGVDIQSTSLAVSADGKVWFTGKEGVWGVLGSISASGDVTKYRTPTGSYVWPYAIVSGPDNAMWFSYYNNETSPGTYSIGRLGY